MKEIDITGEFIRLDAFLKFAGAVDSGGRAKLVIQQEYVTVNGQTETQRGKKIRPGDKVEFGGEIYVCTALTV